MKKLLIILLIIFTTSVKTQTIIPVISDVNENDTTVGTIYDSGIIIFKKDTITIMWYLGGPFWTTADFVKDTVITYEDKIKFSNKNDGDSIMYKSDLIVMYNKDYSYSVLEVIHKKYKKRLGGLSFVLSLDEQSEEFNTTVFYKTPFRRVTLRKSTPRRKYMK